MSAMTAHLAVYADDAVPGNVLRLDNKRKVFCVYVTSKELGPDLVNHADMWLPLAVIRATKHRK